MVCHAGAETRQSGCLIGSTPTCFLFERRDYMKVTSEVTTKSITCTNTATQICKLCKYKETCKRLIDLRKVHDYDETRI